jgi:hypothetical protein
VQLHHQPNKLAHTFPEPIQHFCSGLKACRNKILSVNDQRGPSLIHILDAEFHESIFKQLVRFSNGLKTKTASKVGTVVFLCVFLYTHNHFFTSPKMNLSPHFAALIQSGPIPNREKACLSDLFSTKKIEIKSYSSLEFTNLAKLRKIVFECGSSLKISSTTAPSGR